MRYMLDTDIASYLIRGDHPEVTAKFTELYDSCVMSSITMAELMYGVRKRNNRALTEKVQALCLWLLLGRYPRLRRQSL